MRNSVRVVEVDGVCVLRVAEEKEEEGLRGEEKKSDVGLRYEEPAFREKSRMAWSESSRGFIFQHQAAALVRRRGIA